MRRYPNNQALPSTLRDKSEIEHRTFEKSFQYYDSCGFSFWCWVGGSEDEQPQLFTEVTMPESTAIGAAFLFQARKHLKEDFMPKIRKCLDRLNDADIWWRAHETDNSIGNLLLHLEGNVRQWILSGLGGAPDRRQRPREFSERNPIKPQELWSSLEKAVAEADTVLESFPVEQLMPNRTIQGFETTALQAIFHVVEHFSYHTGQIIYITKSRKAIDLKLHDL
jgi:uncharacterized damage-inducible protein DinB